MDALSDKAGQETRSFDVMDATARIKNLSIALEALSRINHPAAASAFEAIEELLGKEIDQTKRENQWPHSARPARTETDYDPFNPSSLSKA